MTKKRVFITLGVIIGALLLLFFTGLYQFRKIEADNKPYYVKKEEIVKVFQENYDAFDHLRQELELFEIPYYYYDSSKGTHQIKELTSDEALHNELAYFMDTLGFNTLVVHNGNMYISQGRPVAGGDVTIGVVYDKDKDQWFFKYNHGIMSCTHRHKYWYALYDRIYNQEGEIVLEQ